MELIRSYLHRDLPVIPSRTKKDTGQMPFLMKLDHCNRFRALFDQNTFREDVVNTDGEIVDYLDQRVSEQYRNYLKSSQFITIGVWTVGLGFAIFCHKIKWLRRGLGEKSWKMFGLKLCFLVIPYFWMDNLMPAAQEEQIQLLYKKAKPQYRRYKLSGDILQLNPTIQIVDSFLATEVPQKDDQK